MAAKTINKQGIRLTLLLISLCQLGSLAISSVISDITKAFPAVSDQTAQFLMTFPGLLILITSPLSASLVLPQVSLGAVENKRPEQFAMASAVPMAFGNYVRFAPPSPPQWRRSSQAPMPSPPDCCSARGCPPWTL